LTDSQTDVSTTPPQKGRLLIDSTYESTGMSTDADKLADDSASESEIAADWSDLAGLPSAKKSRATSSAAQVIFSRNLALA